MIESIDCITVRAPGKLILSGEHAVNFGVPALAMAIDRWLGVTLVDCPSRRRKERASSGRTGFVLPNSVRPEEARSLRRLEGQSTEQPPSTTLLHHILDHCQLSLNEIEIHSDLWTKSGMGSSAALILALLTLSKKNLSDDETRALATEIEHFQHGRSSGLDIQIISRGGMNLFTHSHDSFIVESRTPPRLPFLLIHTGTPDSSTKDCVLHVKPFFTNSLCRDFKNVTLAMDQALLKNNLEEWKKTISENHRLLSSIGVVPPFVQQFITDIEHENGAAKISGAGSIAGTKAGMVLAVHENLTVLERIAARYSFPFIHTHCAHRGVHVV